MAASCVVGVRFCGGRQRFEELVLRDRVADPRLRLLPGQFQVPRQLCGKAQPPCRQLAACAKAKGDRDHGGGEPADRIGEAALSAACAGTRTGVLTASPAAASHEGLR